MAKVRKSTVKELLESYVKQTAKFTPLQFLTLLRILVKKKDGTDSAYTEKLLAPLYQELSQGRMPHYGLVMVVLEKLNKPFFRRPAKPKAEEEESTMPGNMKVKSSSFVNSKTPAKSKDAELKKKLEKQWRDKMAESYREGSDRLAHIKSVGNGL